MKLLSAVVLISRICNLTYIKYLFFVCVDYYYDDLECITALKNIVQSLKNYVLGF